MREAAPDAARTAPARLVMVLQDLYFGGTQRQALELARGLDPAKYRPEMWLMISGRDFAPLAKQYGIPLRTLSPSKTVGLGEVLALRKALAEEAASIDLLLPLTAAPNIWGRVFGRLAKIPAVIGTCRGGGAPKRQHERLLGRLARRRICKSSALKRILIDKYGAAEDTISVIPNGVDTTHFTPPPEELAPVRDVIVCVARFCADKDHETLVRAFELTLAEHPRAELWLVGSGPDAAKTQRLAKRSKASGAIRMFPAGDPRPFYQQAKILALSSVREGLPNVILEGMAMGLAVAATDVGGVPDVVEHGATGLLSPAGDHAALAASLCALLADEDRRLAFGRLGRKRAEEKYSLESMVRAHQTLFDQVLATV